MTQQFFSTLEAARLAGVTEFRLTYAHRAGYLAEPTYKVTNKRIYTQGDIERVTAYFKDRKHGKRQTEEHDDQ